MKFVVCGALAIGLAEATPAVANDSTSELGAGGLVLTRNAAIEMRSEDLYISDKAVRVRYHFANTAQKDVNVTVAFPMPDITTGGVDDTLGVPTEDQTNFLAFTTLVDGKPVRTRVEQKVIKNGVDRTAYLRGLGVPLNPYTQAADAALDRLPKGRQDDLFRLGLAVNNDFDVGKGMEHHLAAAWTLKTTFFWEQIFPAGREIVVEHRYTPAVGSSAGTQWGSIDWPKDPAFARLRRHYCVDDTFIASAARTRPPGETSSPLTEERIEYVLTTGANWKAPIGEFRMVIDKGDPANLVSFCGEGVRKIGPTTFEVHYRHFTPTREVSVLILKPRPKS
ncbi:MAG TPA: DUF4424 domain-containing protein [Caulobacteraceae bacterium]